MGSQVKVGFWFLEATSPTYLKQVMLICANIAISCSGRIVVPSELRIMIHIQ